MYDSNMLGFVLLYALIVSEIVSETVKPLMGEVVKPIEVS